MSAPTEKLRQTLPGIAQEECRGDNLAILLASYFEPGIDDDEMDDSETWKQGAIDAANRVLDAIHAHYSPAILAAEERGMKRGLDRAAEIARTVETPEEGEYWIANQIEHAILEEINQSAAATSRALADAGEVDPPASPAPIPRPVTFSGSGGEPSTPTSDELSTGPSASADGCGLKSLEAATYHDEATK